MDGRFKGPDTGGLLGDPGSNPSFPNAVDGGRRKSDVVEACVDSGADIICITSNAEDS